MLNPRYAPNPDTTTEDCAHNSAEVFAGSCESESIQRSTTPGGDDPLIGQTVAQYEIVARLGAGGMGVVYLARDRKLGRPVALKFLLPEQRNDESAKEHFICEAQAASATNHRSICTIYDLHETANGQLFIVMAYYAGQTLKQRLADGRLSVRQALDIATEVADGLTEAHAHGIVHRDIKPGNLMLTTDGVKILDFGIAKFKNAVRNTTPLWAFGTVAYMSPEQLRGEEVDGRSDVWALGVVLYEMLMGVRPFQGLNLEGLALAIWTNRPQPPHRDRHDVPPEVGHLVLKALRKNPEHRFQTAAELAARLRGAAGLTETADSGARTTSHSWAFRAPGVARPLRRLWKRLSSSFPAGDQASHA